MAAALVLAAALRLYPVHRPYLHPEQVLLPRAAILATVRADWVPPFLFHGSAFLYALRAVYTVWYHVGRATGAFEDRLDLLEAFVRDPFPFVVAGRLLVWGAGVGTVLLAGRLALTWLGGAGGFGAMLLLAVLFVHVRESHHVWYDVPAMALTLLAVAAGVDAVERRRPGALVAAGALAGAALACKHSFYPVGLPVALAALWGGSPGRGARARRLLGVGAVALGTYALLSPYSFLRFEAFLAAARFTVAAVRTTTTPALALGSLVASCLGIGVSALALLGLVESTRRGGRPAIVLAAFPVLYLLTLAAGSRLHARYLAALAPFAALYAAAGAQAVAAVIAPGRAIAVATGLVVLAALGPARQSLGYDLLLARPDTRQLAGAWLRRHVPAGTPLTLPSANGYPNPSLPETERDLTQVYGRFAPALRARGLGDPAATYPATYLTGVMGGLLPDWRPGTPVIVTAEHPVVLRVARIPDAYLHRLEEAGARRVAVFEGFAEPLPADVVYDPIDANYVPLTGHAAIGRPGPNIGIWQMPGPADRGPTSTEGPQAGAIAR